MSICAAVVGAGRMGAVVAKQLPRNTEKIIIDIDPEKAGQLAQMVGGMSSDILTRAEAADLVAVVLPTPVVKETVDKLLAVVKDGTIILNMATTAHIDEGVRTRHANIAVIDAKIIGHAGSMARGEPGIVVIDCSDKRRFDFIKDQLPGFHRVVQGETNIVEKINKIASTEGIRAAVAVRKRLGAIGVPDEWIDVAIRTVCAGTLKSYAEDDLGHFALELVKKLEKEPV